MKCLASVALCLALAAPALGQAIDFQQLLDGKAFPHSLQLKELNGDWRRLGIGTTDGAKNGSNDMMSQLVQIGMMSDMGKNKGKNDAAAAMIGMSLLSGLFGGESKEPVYYTRGQTVTVGSETFLVVYRAQKPQMNLIQVAMEAEKSGKEPDFGKMAAQGKLSPDSPLAFSLINVRTISTLTSVRPFDLDREIAESAQGGGLMEFIAQQAAKEASAPKPAPKAVAPRKPAAKPKPHR